MITNSLKRFTNNFANRKLHEYFLKIKQVVKHYDNACQLLKFQPYYIDKEQYATEISKLLTTKKEHELLMLPVAYKGHAISLIKYGNFLAHCDRGEYGRERGSSVVIYYLPDPHLFNEEFAKKLLYTRVDKEFIEHDMQRILMLEPQIYFNLPYQTIGNCSWSNVEAALPVMLFFLRLHEMYETNQAAPLPIDGTHVSQAREFAMLFYDKWKIWDRYSALQQCIDTFYSTSNQRQLTKASILAAILFQRSDEDDPYYYESTRKVLSILSKPEFSYILKTYLKNFYHTKATAIGKKLAELLDEFGVDINGHE
jgi:hypothetical protein